MKDNYEANIVELLNNLIHDDYCVRHKAAITLAKSATPEFKTWLTDQLLLHLNNDDFYLREKAIQALGHLGDKRVIEPIISLLDTHTHSWRAVEALWNLKDERAIKPLIYTLKKYVRFQDMELLIIKALDSFGDAAIDQLVVTLESDDLQLRQQASFALFKISRWREERENSTSH